MLHTRKTENECSHPIESDVTTMNELQLQLLPF